MIKIATDTESTHQHNDRSLSGRLGCHFIKHWSQVILGCGGAVSAGMAVVSFLTNNNIFGGVYTFLAIATIAPCVGVYSLVPKKAIEEDVEQLGSHLQEIKQEDLQDDKINAEREKLNKEHQHQMDQAAKKISELTDSFQKKTKKLSSTKAALKRSEGKLVQLEGLLKKNNEILNKLKQGTETFVSTVQLAKTSNDKLAQQNQKLDHVGNLFQGEVSELKGHATVFDQENSEFEQNINELGKQIECLKTLHTQIEEENKKLQEKSSGLAAQNERLESDVKQLQALQIEFKQLQTELINELALFKKK